MVVQSRSADFFEAHARMTQTRFENARGVCPQVILSSRLEQKLYILYDVCTAAERGAGDVATRKAFF